MRFSRLLYGLPAGLVGGMAGALLLWGSWMLPTLGLIMTRVNLIRGAATLLIIGTLGGLLYALLLGDRRLRLGAALLTGAIWGAVLWLLGPMVLVPLFLGLPAFPTGLLDQWLPLMAFVVYGIIVSLLYTRWGLGQSRRRAWYALGLLLASAVLTPFLLRAAISTDPQALDLPAGYRAEVVARGLTFPTGIVLSGDTIYVAEAGYSYGPKEAVARILAIDAKGHTTEVARDFKGPINGLAMGRENVLYVSHRGAVTALDLNSGERWDLITGLPSLGDHQNNDLALGPDDAIYFGQGTATNAGVVGADNFVYAWADRYPDFHDIPSRDFTLTGENYVSLDPGTADPDDKKTTGAFAPFGEKREEGQKIQGQVPASGAIHRIDLKTGRVTVYADGLRNPYGLAFSPQGELYATNLGYDDRGVRAVKGSPDWVVRVRRGAWYGWPDFAGTLPLTEAVFASKRGVNRDPLIADPPPVEPPLATLPPHYSPMKLAFAPAQFGRAGLYVAVFGDGQPLTEDLKEQAPTGVLQVDPATGKFDWFARNREEARAGRMGDGFKRIIDVKFSTDDGSMYILDFGVMEFTDLAPNAIPNTGVLWRVYHRR